MSAPTAKPPYTLRDLPLPAKLVVTCFLVSVGMGYLSALVQIHFQHAGKGHFFPTPSETVEKFSGYKDWFQPQTAAAEPVPKPPVSKLESLFTLEPGLNFSGSGTMSPAFFDKCPDYRKSKKKGGEDHDKLHAERLNEHAALVAWIKSEPAARKKAFEDDAFPLPAELKGKPVGEDFLNEDKFLIKSLLEVRCAGCHGSAGGEGKVELAEYAHYEPYLKPPVVAVTGGKVVEKSPKQMGVERLAQSTHAHLLSFAMLFTLTGFTFAFTSYSAVVRGLLAPLVLAAQITDVACWWLARVDGVGPYFALAILGTGGVVGAGLMLQILLSLWDMFGGAGRAVLLMLGTLAVLGFLVVKMAVIDTQLAAEKAEIEEQLKQAVHQKAMDEPAADKAAKPAPPAKAAEPPKPDEMPKAK